MRLRLSLALAALAAASIGLKFLVLRADVAIDPTQVTRDLAALAQARGMEAQVQPLFGSGMMTASRGACMLAASPLPASGELDQSITNAFAGFARVRYSWRQTLSAARPRVGPLISFQWARAANRLGIPIRWQPLLIVGDNGHCDRALTDFAAIEAVFRQEVPSLR